MAQNHIMLRKEEKRAIVKRHLAGETGISERQARNWTNLYLTNGDAGLEPKKKPGNPLSRYELRKELSYTEQLQYEIELLKRELLKKNEEVLRLKKCNARKEGDALKKRSAQCISKYSLKQTGI